MWKQVVDSVPFMQCVDPMHLPQGLHSPNIPFRQEVAANTFMGIHPTVEWCWEALPGRLYLVYDQQHKDVVEAYARCAWIISEYMWRLTRHKPAAPPAVMLVLHDAPKKWDGCACPRAINSGVCFGDYFIMVWRMEEMFKVLIHEHVHAYKWDVLPVKHIEFIKVAPTSARAPREAITETITTLMTSHIESLLTGSPMKDILREQVGWATNQAAYLWSVLPKDKEGRFIQATDAVSYYILRALWLWDLHPDVDGCEELRGLFLQNTLFPEARKGTLDSRKLRYRLPVRRFRKVKPSLRMSPPGLLDGLLQVWT